MSFTIDFIGNIVYNYLSKSLIWLQFDLLLYSISAIGCVATLALNLDSIQDQNTGGGGVMESWQQPAWLVM